MNFSTSYRGFEYVADFHQETGKCLDLEHESNRYIRKRVEAAKDYTERLRRDIENVQTILTAYRNAYLVLESIEGTTHDFRAEFGITNKHMSRGDF